jgi:hypothetical protein
MFQKQKLCLLLHGSLEQINIHYAHISCRRLFPPFMHAAIRNASTARDAKTRSNQPFRTSDPRWYPHSLSLLKLVLAVNPDILQLGKVVEMQRSVNAVVKADGRVEAHVHGLLLDGAERAAHEAVVPDAVVRHEEIAADLVRKEKLALLSERGAEAGGAVRHGVLVVRTPLVSLRCQCPRCE